MSIRKVIAAMETNIKARVPEIFFAFGDSDLDNDSRGDISVVWVPSDGAFDKPDQAGGQRVGRPLYSCAQTITANVRAVSNQPDLDDFTVCEALRDQVIAAIYRQGHGSVRLRSARYSSPGKLTRGYACDIVFSILAPVTDDGWTYANVTTIANDVDTTTPPLGPGEIQFGVNS